MMMRCAERAERSILDRHFSRLTAKHVQWRTRPSANAMKARDDGLLRRSSLFQFLPDEYFEKIRPLLQEKNITSSAISSLGKATRPMPFMF